MLERKRHQRKSEETWVMQYKDDNEDSLDDCKEEEADSGSTEITCEQQIESTKSREERINERSTEKERERNTAEEKRCNKEHLSLSLYVSQIQMRRRKRRGMRKEVKQRRKENNSNESTSFSLERRRDHSERIACQGCRTRQRRWWYRKKDWVSASKTKGQTQGKKRSHDLTLVFNQVYSHVFTLIAHLLLPCCLCLKCCQDLRGALPVISSLSSSYFCRFCSGDSKTSSSSLVSSSHDWTLFSSTMDEFWCKWFLHLQQKDGEKEKDCWRPRREMEDKEK